MFFFGFVFMIFILTVLSSKRGGAKTFHPVVVQYYRVHQINTPEQPSTTLNNKHFFYKKMSMQKPNPTKGYMRVYRKSFF